MYRFTSYRPNRRFVNLASQRRGLKWAQLLDNDAAFSLEDTANENAWLTVYGRSANATDVKLQIDLLNQALSLADNQQDRSLIICSIIDVEIIRHCKSISADLMDELVNFVLSLKELTEEFAERVGSCCAGLAAMNDIDNFSQVIRHIEKLYVQTLTEENLNRGSDILRAIGYYKLHSWSYNDLPSVAVRARQCGIWKSLWEVLAYKNPEAYYKSDIEAYLVQLQERPGITISPRISSIINWALQLAAQNQSTFISDRHVVLVLLGDYFPFCFGSFLLHKLDVDVDDLFQYMSNQTDVGSDTDLFLDILNYAIKKEIDFIDPDTIFEVILRRNLNRALEHFAIDLSKD